MSYSECTDDLNRVCSDLENYAGATDLALAQISDDNFLLEVKKKTTTSPWLPASSA